MMSCRMFGAARLRIVATKSEFRASKRALFARIFYGVMNT
ncbi:MAG: hypothetical protein A4E48_01142 [Methanosaeta sp. PtaU1.Bin060]|nr:MAG: hypothetical protein A4E48_01142 [Methanosaeta sp. PtaU1.Bin060]